MVNLIEIAEIIAAPYEEDGDTREECWEALSPREQRDTLAAAAQISDFLRWEFQRELIAEIQELRTALRRIEAAASYWAMRVDGEEFERMATIAKFATDALATAKRKDT